MSNSVILWRTNVDRVKEKLVNIKVTISRLKTNELIKRDLIDQLDIALRQINKGVPHDREINKLRQT